MAYTTPNTGIIRPWTHSKQRYVHRQLTMTCPNPTASVIDTVSIPGPGRLVAIQYSLNDGYATDPYTLGSALTSGALTLKAETTAGAQIWTDANLASTVSTRPNAIGTTAGDETNAATAATDGFSGGFPLRKGVFATFSSGTADEVLVVDMWFRLCTYVKLDLVSQTGADASGAVTRYVGLGNAGVLSAVAVDYQNISSGTTADILIKADSTNGPTLWGNASSTTDIAPTLVGGPALDEAVNAGAATDGTESGNAFRRGLFVDVAQSDAFTSGNERIIMELWIDD